MRTDQYVGLSSRAIEFLKENAELDHFQLLKNGVIDQDYYEPKKEVFSTLIGAFQNEFPLFTYFLENGEKVYEYVQAEPWSSGPMYYIALSYDPEGTDPVIETLWTEEEMGI